MEPSQDRLFQCLSCPATFERREHLARHVHRHSGAKPFVCSFAGCDKAFARRDTLMRHISVHGADTDATNEASSSTSRLRGAHACLPCSKAKQRCQGGTPCARCLRKSLSCHFSTPRLPSRSEIGVNSTNDAESSFTIGTTDSLENRTAWQVIETSVSSTLPRVSNHAAGDISPLPLSGPLESETSLTTSNHLSGPPVVSCYADYNGFGSAQVSDMLNSGSLNSSTGDLNFGFDTFSIPFDEFAHLDQDSSLQYYNYSLIPSADPLIRQTQESPSSVFPSDRGIRKQIGHENIPNHPPSFSNCSNPASFGPRSILNWASSTLNISPEFPKLQPCDEDILAVDDFRHVKKISDRSYQAIRQFHRQSPAVQDATFPASRTLNNFIQLYFEYFDSEFPFLHHSIFDADEPPWILLVAVMVIGSQYSRLTNTVAYTAALQELLRQAIAMHLPEPSARVEVSFVQCVLLRDISLIFNGSQSARLHAQTQRNMLVTLCRSISLEEIAADTPSHDIDRQYKLWLASESRNRMVYCVFRLECLQLILFDLPPLFQLEELTTRPLFGDDLWTCRNSSQWEACFRSKGGLHPFSAAVQQRKQNTSTCENFAQEMHLVHLYVEERIVSDKLTSSPLRKIYFTTSSRNNGSQDPGFNSRSAALHAPIMKFLTAFLDKELAYSQPTGNSGSSGPQCGALLEVLAHVFHLLRRVPLKRLYSFTGWDSDEAGIAAAKNELLSWMQISVSATRACLWHAIRIYTSLSRKQRFACYDPYLFLISTLFIYAYDQLSPPLNSSISMGETSADFTIMRFDRPTDESELKAWMAQTGKFRIYVPDIGALNDTGSSSRLLEHTHRILMSRSGWQSLCQGIAGGVKQMIRGDRPSYPTEV